MVFEVFRKLVNSCSKSKAKALKCSVKESSCPYQSVTNASFSEYFVPVLSR